MNWFQNSVPVFRKGYPVYYAEHHFKKCEDRIMALSPITAGSEIFCSANAALDLLSSRWTLHIVRSLLTGKKRFNEIAREYGINPSTLRDRLRSLEEENVVERVVVSTMPLNVEYSLTEKGLALNCIFEALADWGKTWMPEPKPDKTDI